MSWLVSRSASLSRACRNSSSKWHKLVLHGLSFLRGLYLVWVQGGSFLFLHAVYYLHSLAFHHTFREKLLCSCRSSFFFSGCVYATWHGWSFMLQPRGSTWAPLLQSRHHLPQSTTQFYESKWSGESRLPLQVCKELFFFCIWSSWRVHPGMNRRGSLLPIFLGMVKRLIFRKL